MYLHKEQLDYSRNVKIKERKAKEELKQSRKFQKEVREYFQTKVENIFDRDDRKYIDNDETSSCVYTLFGLTIYCSW